MKTSTKILAVLVLVIAGLWFGVQGATVATDPPVLSAIQAQAAQAPEVKKPVYTCDAPTKTTGKPCKRRVREAGLVCWQHRPKV